jgi:UDP:flavonoid glycosyltransferase YjiC (YdhE family)
LEWLDARPEKSVVYLSFGSLLTYTVRQVEILHGLQDCGRRYLWVVRREGRAEDVDLCLKKKPGKQGMVVEWCDQLRVLSHPSVGCFVTHCGWNSALEAVVHGVPMVAVPVWSDQPMNAHLVEEWSVGVRAERDADGILTRSELVSCVELLMGDGDKAKKIIASANHLKKRAKDALTNDGALLNFVDRILEVPMND